MQLESGKVIAIRASVKSGQQMPGVEQKLGGMSSISEALDNRPKFPTRTEEDVIDISNDDDEDESRASVPPNQVMPEISMMQQLAGTGVSLEASNGSATTTPLEQPSTSSDIVYKEKTVYKPNLVQRKPKMAPPPVPPLDTQPLKRFDSGYQTQQRPPPPPKWDSQKNFSNIPSSSFYNRNGNGSAKTQPLSFRNRKYS